MPLPNLDLHNLEGIVLEKCDSFVRLGVWPGSEQLNYRGWLANFPDPEDRRFALHLLNSFTFYNSELCAALLFGSMQSLSVPFSRSRDMVEAMSVWKEELERTLYVPVEGEKPNITDSGYLLANMVRKRLLIPEDRIKPFDQLLLEIARGQTKSTRVVFFDDFIGSGQQFVKLLMTSRMNNIPNQLLLDSSCEVIYCCFVATSYGLNYISAQVPNAKVAPAHIIDETHSVAVDNSRVWPSELRLGVGDFILRSSRRADIEDDDRLGFHRLGLALAFEHTIPDASLPLFYSVGAGWTPMMRRA